MVEYQEILGSLKGMLHTDAFVLTNSFFNSIK